MNKKCCIVFPLKTRQGAISVVFRPLFVGGAMSSRMHSSRGGGGAASSAQLVHGGGGPSASSAKVGGAVGGPRPPSVTSGVHDQRAKTILKEAVDAVVNSFAKHTQGYGRGEFHSFILFTNKWFTLVQLSINPREE